MAKITFTRNDVEDLAQRLESKAKSTLMDDMPSTQRDMMCAAALLRDFIGRPFPIVLDIHNGIY